MKMKCEEMLAALSDYVDGDLAPDVYEAFREHLTACGPCEVVVDTIRQTITVYRCGRPTELPGDLQDHLRRVLRQRWKAKFPAADV